MLREDGKLPDYVLDGMTNDVEGNLFVATYNGHRIMKINPKWVLLIDQHEHILFDCYYFFCRNGELLAEYKFPLVSKVTSVAWGGPNMDILFATTASRGNNEPPESGHLYKISGLGTRGTPGVKVKL